MMKHNLAGVLLIGLAAQAVWAKGIAERELPSAGPAMQIAQGRVLTRIAVASCNRQTLDQSYWPRIIEAGPDLFLMIGDNVYGDPGWDGGDDLGTFRAAYARLGAEPGFLSLRANVPMLATWDDHDFGPNDSGGSFVYKAQSEHLFEHFWDAPAEARAHPGVYHATIAGVAGQLVQVIMLDTRFFRSDLAFAPQEDWPGRLGRIAPLADPSATMLGEEQWRWLEQQLAKPADLRIIVSSIQVLSEAHHFESWSQFPLEKDRLLRVLAGRADSGLVLLSGDRHAAALYQAELPGGEEVWEMTASSLNAPLAAPDPSGREPDPLRRTPMLSQGNFGMLEIDWAARRVSLAVEGTSGGRLARQDVGF